MSGAVAASTHCHLLPWAARYNTWLLIKLTPKGVVFSFLFLPFTCGTNKTHAAETHILYFTAGTISWNFITPVVREFCLMHGMCDVSRKTMVELLSTPGRALMVAIGGASEALLAAPGTMDLILNKRQCPAPALPFFCLCPALPVLLSYWWLQCTPRDVTKMPLV